jgi:hypothetical protein
MWHCTVGNHTPGTCQDLITVHRTVAYTATATESDPSYGGSVESCSCVITSGIITLGIHRSKLASSLLHRCTRYCKWMSTSNTCLSGLHNHRSVRLSALTSDTNYACIGCSKYCETCCGADIAVHYFCNPKNQEI